MLPEQRVVEGYGDAAIGILDIEDDGVASDFTPVLNHPQAVLAASHESGEVDGADFEILRDGNRFLGDRSGEDSGNDDVFVRFQEVNRVGLVINLADRFG